MIKVINKNSNQEIKVNIQSPVCIYYSFLLMLTGLFLSLLGDGVLMMRVSSLLLVVGAIQSRGKVDFGVFYKIPLTILIIEVLFDIMFLMISFSNVDLVMVLVVLKIGLTLCRCISLGYNVINGRKKQLIRLYNIGFEIANENELSVKELKLIGKT
ncbi:hypothetical protein RZE82_06540 [Mollicutes bacterium LVI A0039]|nr:hypothetical protein RZE82_06540 [Mollicutes bacterium LVI A0039]